MDYSFERFTTAGARFAGRLPMLMICLGFAGLAGIALIVGNDRLLWGASLAMSIVTVLLLPILQETQNRDSSALHAKLDELIKTHGQARNELIGLENRTVDEIRELRPDEEASPIAE